MAVKEEDHDGFRVEEKLSLSEWVDFEFDRYGEYIHLIPDPEAKELRCYRSIGEVGDGQRVMTTLNGVNFLFNWLDGEKPIKGFYLTDNEAETFMSFIDLILSGRESSIGFNWWEETGMPMMKDKETGIEEIILRFTKPNGVQRKLTITSAWQVPVHKMVKFGEGSF